MDEPLAELQRSVREGIARSSVASCEVFAQHVDRGFARFSRGELEQHIAIDECKIMARAAVTTAEGTRLATVLSTDASPDAIARTLRQAERVARVTPVCDGWPGFAQAKPALSSRHSTIEPLGVGPRADRVAALLGETRARGLLAAGALESSVQRAVIENTEGRSRAGITPFASCKVFALSSDGVSGFAQRTTRDVETLDGAALAREASEKCLAGADPMVLEAGEYDVILEPSAVVELLEWLAFTTFGAREFHDGSSAFAGKLGDKITGDRITLVEAGDAPEGFALGFDREGVDREPLVLIAQGRAERVVYDRLVGARHGVESTGNSAPLAAFDDAPIAQALTLLGGEETVESLTAKVSRGLHISRFHYVNGFLEPRRTLMTGLTRDGTFLIERGERTRGVRNMRFTDSVFEAFGRCEGLTRALSAVPTWWSESGAFVAPTMLIRGLRFTGGGVEPPKGV
ncbi:MAG: TldD/PmbA family protein [Deltaproteobacteria bacterium]|nr:TldD/PmbA family protein [Deltaproteobacteria bacterium]